MKTLAIPLALCLAACGGSEFKQEREPPSPSSGSSTSTGSASSSTGAMAGVVNCEKSPDDLGPALGLTCPGNGIYQFYACNMGAPPATEDCIQWGGMPRPNLYCCRPH